MQKCIHKKLPFLCWNCQIWANSNTFDIILGQTRGQENIWETNALMPPVALPLKQA